MSSLQFLALCGLVIAAVYGIPTPKATSAPVTVTTAKAPAIVPFGITKKFKPSTAPDSVTTPTTPATTTTTTTTTEAPTTVAVAKDAPLDGKVRSLKYF